MSTDISAERYAIPKATLLFMVLDERHSRVDVLNHNVPNIPSSLRTCFGYCFPQPSLVGVVLAHVSKYEARAVPWYLTLERRDFR